MNAQDAPDIREYQMGVMRRRLDELPRTLDPGVAHVSELSLCPVKPHYARTLDEQPLLSDESTLQFMRGRGLERFLSGELPVKELDGIVGTVDGQVNGDLIEVKSTNMDMGRFDPLKGHEWWITQMKAYCHLYGATSIHLIVWFLSGDSFTTRKVKTDLRAWTLTFTEDELRQNWDYLKAERAKMFACIDAGTLPDEAWVKSRRKGFECPGCRYSLLCPYFNHGGM